MLAALVISSLRVLTWCCVILLAILSLLPAEEMVRTGLPGRLEHFVAYAGSAAIRVGLLGRRGFLPLVEVIDRHQAAAPLKRFAESGPVLDPLSLGR